MAAENALELFYRTLAGTVGVWWQRLGRSVTDLGEPIAVLMGPRPTYLSVTAALSRPRGRPPRNGR
jgi:hypothetical protein